MSASARTAWLCFPFVKAGPGLVLCLWEDMNTDSCSYSIVLRSILWPQLASEGGTTWAD